MRILDERFNYGRSKSLLSLKITGEYLNLQMWQLANLGYVAI